MLKYCKEKRASNENLFREAIENLDIDECYIGYPLLVMMIVKYILNPGAINYEKYSENIHEINDGDYQGALLFLVHKDTYLPESDDYLITTVEYGSCSGCDTLLNILECMDYDDHEKNRLTKRQVDAIMNLCRDMVVKMKQPFGFYSKMEEVEDQPDV